MTELNAAQERSLPKDEGHEISVQDFESAPGPSCRPGSIESTNGERH